MQKSQLTCEKPLILAVETSGRQGSVAVGIGDRLIAEISFSGLMRHSNELFPAIQGLLSQINRKIDEISHIYISAGPGSFTGVRISVTFAKTMHLACGTKIVAVDTLDAIAENADDYTSVEPINTIATILDAKRSQFFIASFQRRQNRWKKTLNDTLMTPSDFLSAFPTKNDEQIWLLGEGLMYHKDKFKAENVRFIDPAYWPAKAGKIYTIGRRMAEEGKFADALTLVPTYIRGPEVGQNLWTKLH